MKNNMKYDIGCFTADFRENKVIIGDKSFLAGYFFVNALNEYQKEAPDGVNSDPNGDWLILNRIVVNNIDIYQLQDDITIGYLDEKEAETLHKDIQYILRVISSAKPFIYLNLDAEKERCDVLFGDESVKRINHFLKVKARHTLQSDEYWMNHKRPGADERRWLEEEQAHLNNYLAALDYYFKLGNDMNAALDFGESFVKRLASLESRDESHLVVFAMECLKQVPFRRWNNSYQNTMSPNVEYLAIPNKTKSKNFVVGKRMTFVRFLDFLVADFFEGLHCGHYPELCQNCKQYYLKTNSRRQKYCTNIDPNDPKRRTCQAVAAAKGRAEKERHPLRIPYENRLKTIRTHVKRGKITEKQAAAAYRIARDRLDRALFDYEYAKKHYETEIGQASVYEAAGIKL